MAIPGPGDRVFINNGELVNLGVVSDTIQYLEIAKNSILNIRGSGALNVRGHSNDLSAIFISEGELLNGGSIFVTSDPLNGTEGIYIDAKGEYAGSGSITINDLPDFGDEAIKNFGIVVIDGSVKISNTAYIAIWNHNSFTINSSGSVHISHIDGRGFQSTDGICTNHGLIQVDNVLDGMYVTGEFHNYDSIFIDSCSSKGIYIQDQFTNYPGGYINIDSTGNVGVDVYALGDLYNHGELILQNIGAEGIVTFANREFINYGSLQIDSCFGDGIEGNGSFVNYGTMEIQRVLQGMDLTGSFLDTCKNFGMMHILDTRRQGIYSSRPFINGVNGVVSINGTGFFRSGFRQSGYMENHGEITIQNTASHGLELHLRSIYNYNRIDISQCVENAIHNTTAELYNEPDGEIYLTDMVGDSSIAIFNEDIVENKGIISIQDAPFGILAADSSSIINHVSGNLLIGNCNEPLEIPETAVFDCVGILDTDHP